MISRGLEGWALAWWRKPLWSIRLAIQSELCLISLVVFPRDVAGMSVLHYRNPLGAGHILHMDLPIGGSGHSRSSIDVSSRIRWLVEHPQNIMMLDFSPGDLSLMGSTTDPSWKEQSLLSKMANRGAR